MMAKYLFVCTANIQRSKTAEDYFKQVYPQHQFKSAGTNRRICEQYQTTLLTEELLAWADAVWVMEQKHKDRIEEYTQNRFIQKIKVLHIEDVYPYYDPKLIEILNLKLRNVF